MQDTLIGDGDGLVVEIERSDGNSGSNARADGAVDGR